MLLLRNVSKVYATPGGEVRALDGVNIQIGAEECVVLRGPSGSGKTTLLMTAGALLRPTSGDVSFEGRDFSEIGARGRASFRARTIGFIFQSYHLIPYLNVLENVLLAAGAIRGASLEKRGRELLRHLGMEERSLHRPAELSAGEKQRTAIARALLNGPKLLLADEPTGNLDRESAGWVLGCFSEFRRGGGTVMIATHEPAAEEIADRVFKIHQGRILEQPS